MALKTKITVPPYAPYNPPKMSSAVVYAAKAVFAGEALKDQQRLFAEWLIKIGRASCRERVCQYV